jgi:hypothetical protein
MIGHPLKVRELIEEIDRGIRAARMKDQDGGTDSPPATDGGQDFSGSADSLT